MVVVLSYSHQKRVPKNITEERVNDQYKILALNPKESATIDRLSRGKFKIPSYRPGMRNYSLVLANYDNIAHHKFQYGPTLINAITVMDPHGRTINKKQLTDTWNRVVDRRIMHEGHLRYATSMSRNSLYAMV